jgi:integrase/recombinase XerD
MRDSAIVSLPIGCFDLETLQVNQSPKEGVKTKFSKSIKSTLFRFDDSLLGYVSEWVKYLKETLLYGNAAPLFPKNKVENSSESKTFVSNSVEAAFWQSVNSMREIFKERFSKAGIEYFPPHALRHLAVKLAVSRCKNGHEIKAVSQNFGHENVGTTMVTYGSMNNLQVAETIAAINFSEEEDSNNDIINQFQEFLKMKKKNNF